MNKEAFLKRLVMGMGIGLATPLAIFVGIVFVISFDKAQVETMREACQFVALRFTAVQSRCDDMKKSPVRLFRNPFALNQ